MDEVGRIAMEMVVAERENHGEVVIAHSAVLDCITIEQLHSMFIIQITL